MELIKATLKDLSALQKICTTAYQHNFANHWNENGLELYLEEQFGTVRLTKDLKNAAIGYYFIITNKIPAGFVKINFEATLAGFESIPTCELEKIYLLPEWHGKGLGKAALESIFEISIKKRKNILFLCVIDTNTSAIGFYEKLDFRFHSKTRLEAAYFKEALKGMNRMYLELKEAKIINY